MKLTIEQALQQGIAAHREGKFKEAERLYRAILQYQPTHPDANHNLGIIAVACGKYEAALPFFKKAIEANGKQEQYLKSFLEALIKLGKIHTARTVLQQADPVVRKTDKIKSLEGQLNHPSKLDFFIGILGARCFYLIEELLNGDSEHIPLNSFLTGSKRKNGTH